MTTVSERLEVLARTRRMAAGALARTLRESLAQSGRVSETSLRDRWLAYMRESGSVYADGWYMPPPHGMIVLFATDGHPDRLHHPSYRGAEAWSRDDIYLDRDRGLMMLYASPVDKSSGMIGDFGVVLYLGDRPEVRAHLARCLKLNSTLAQEVTPDLPLATVARRAHELIRSQGMSNTVVSTSDPAGANMGHTIPALVTGWTASERAVFERDDWSAIKDMISRKRRFVSLTETLAAGEAEAFTIEPRPSVDGQPNLPMTAYHTIMAFDQGKKRFITDFDELFALCGMDYMPQTIVG